MKIRNKIKEFLHLLCPVEHKYSNDIFCRTSRHKQGNFYVFVWLRNIRRIELFDLIKHSIHENTIEF